MEELYGHCITDDLARGGLQLHRVHQAEEVAVAHVDDAPRHEGPRVVDVDPPGKDDRVSCPAVAARLTGTCPRDLGLSVVGRTP